MIFDVLGQRERAVNEYSKVKQTNDNTGNAQQMAETYLKKPYTEGGVSVSAQRRTQNRSHRPPQPSPLRLRDKPVLKSLPRRKGSPPPSGNGLAPSLLVALLGYCRVDPSELNSFL